MKLAMCSTQQIQAHTHTWESQWKHTYIYINKLFTDMYFGRYIL